MLPSGHDVTDRHTDSQHRQLLIHEPRKSVAKQNSSMVGQGLIGPPPLDEEYTGN